ncbi:MAG: FAD-dependent monooxygenase [Planctomycetota bacterium]
MKESWDAVVAGAGPAGALAARGLSQRGRRVLLVDRQRFPRPKVCGCCLNRYALSSLDAAGLGGLAERLGARPLGRLTMIAGGRSASIELPRGVSLSREALDTSLTDAAIEAGCTFRDGVSAKVRRLGTDAEDGHELLLGREVIARTKVLVVADGLGGSALSDVPGFGVVSKPASRIGFGGQASTRRSGVAIPDGTIAMACGRRGYLGAVRLEDGRLDFAAAVDAAAVREAGGPAGAAARVLEEAGIDPGNWPLDGVGRWRVSPTLTRTRSRLAGPGLFVVGDAAGYVEPFTGEGMAWAIAGGVAVAAVADRAVDGWLPEQEVAWEHAFRGRVRRRQAGCRWVAATLRRPRLTRSVVRVLSVAPRLAAPLVGRITRPARGGLTHPPGPASRPGAYA